jgi:hypothetical protein
MWIVFTVIVKLDTSDKAYLYMVIIYCILYFLPTIYLHLTYYIKDKETEVQLNNSHITISNGGQAASYKYEEVVKWRICMTADRMASNSFGKFPFVTYYFIQLNFTDGNEYILTSLLHHKIAEMLIEKIQLAPIEDSFFYPAIHTLD